MKGLSLCLGLVLSISLAMVPSAFSLDSSRLVINELRKLRVSLPPRDPSRLELTLRLADRLADQCLLGKTRNSNADGDRNESVALYQEALTHVNGPLRIKVQFQLARLYLDRGDHASKTKAAEWLRITAAQSEVKAIKRESVMRLAELAEEQPGNEGAASTYYRQALELCESGDGCSYAHYRLAWVLKNEGKLSSAIAEMKLALFDSTGQPREEALRDWIMMMGLDPKSVDQSVAAVDELAQRLSRPSLLNDLSSSYFSSGQKAAGVVVLELIQSRHPTLDANIRLLEEYYGMRSWDSFRLSLDELVRSTEEQPRLKDAVQAEKICRRLATQLDAERATDPSRFPDFKRFVLAYLDLFPVASDRAKVMEGLIVADPDPAQKLALIHAWTSDPKFKLSTADFVLLRDLRVAIAQKEILKNGPDSGSMHQIVIEEVEALIALQPDSPKKREYRYSRARSLYAQKKFAEAMPVFQELAGTEGRNSDSLTIQSRNLILDIYNQQKNYAQIVETAKPWLADPAIARISEEAEFQLAVSQGETTEALALFMSKCKAGKFLPKSCENAKLLSVKLQDEARLIELLTLDPGAAGELAQEYENAGYFGKAAVELKKQMKAPTFVSQMKIALMAELGRMKTLRDEQLQAISKQIASGKLTLSEVEEDAFLSTLLDTRLLSEKALNQVTRPELKLRYAERIAHESVIANQAPSSHLEQLLLSSPSYRGPAWSWIVLRHARKKAEEQARIKFYGRNGKTLFERRLTRLKELNQFADRYLSGGADLVTRVKLLMLVQEGYESVQAEILASPLPPGLNDDQLAEIKTGLEEMAKPFHEKSAALHALIDQEKAKASTPEERQFFSGSADQIQISRSSAVNPQFEEAEYQAAVEALHSNPRDLRALSKLKQVFSDSGAARLASYFEGRMKSTGVQAP